MAATMANSSRSELVLNWDGYSCVTEYKEAKIHVPLAPSYLGSELKGVKMFLDSWKNRYVRRFKGVLLSYSNLRFSERMSLLITDQPFIHENLSGNFIVFTPVVGCLIKGKLLRMNGEFAVCLIHGCVNATIKMFSKLPKGLEPYLRKDQEIIFKVTAVGMHRKYLRIKGIIDEECVIALEKEIPVDESLCSFVGIDESEIYYEDEESAKNMTDFENDIEYSESEAEMNFCAVEKLLHSTEINHSHSSISGKEGLRTDVSNISTEEDPQMQSLSERESFKISKKKKSKKKKKDKESDFGGSSQDLFSSPISSASSVAKSLKHKKIKTDVLSDADIENAGYSNVGFISPKKKLTPDAQIGLLVSEEFRQSSEDASVTSLEGEPKGKKKTKKTKKDFVSPDVPPKSTAVSSNQSPLKVQQKIQTVSDDDDDIILSQAVSSQDRNVREESPLFSEFENNVFLPKNAIQRITASLESPLLSTDSGRESGKKSEGTETDKSESKRNKKKKQKKEKDKKDKSSRKKKKKKQKEEKGEKKTKNEEKDEKKMKKDKKGKKKKKDKKKKESKGTSKTEESKTEAVPKKLKTKRKANDVLTSSPNKKRKIE